MGMMSLSEALCRRTGVSLGIYRALADMYKGRGMNMVKRGYKPTVTLDLQETVNRIGHLRRQLKVLESEEALLRDQILIRLKDWPEEIFPLRIGEFEVRLGERKARLDPALAETILRQASLLEELPKDPQVQNAEAYTRFVEALSSLDMPTVTRRQLTSALGQAITVRAHVSQGAIDDLRHSGRLSEEEYRACFKDGRPTITTLTVR